MTETNDGGPAFPCGEDYEVYSGNGDMERRTTHPLYHGATLRDYFAAEALTGLLTVGWQHPDEAAQHAYKMADAMLAERERAGGEG